MNGCGGRKTAFPLGVQFSIDKVVPSGQYAPTKIMRTCKLSASMRCLTIVYRTTFHAERGAPAN